jgi:hypothetical protein
VTILFGDAHNFGRLRSIERGGGGGIRKGNFETLTFPISSSRGREEQAVARDVNALANFFKRLGGIESSHVNLRGDLGAFATTAFDGSLGSR